MRTRRHGWWLGVQRMGAGRVPHLAISHNAPGLTKACRRRLTAFAALPLPAAADARRSESLASDQVIPLLGCAEMPPIFGID